MEKQDCRPTSLGNGEVPYKIGEWIHGFHIRTSHKLGEPPRPINPTPKAKNEILITFSPHKPALDGAVLWRITPQEMHGGPSLTLHSGPRPATYLLDIICDGRGSFLFSESEIQIYWEPGGTGPQHYFHSFGLAFWLEMHRIPCLHANSLELNGRGIGLMAPTRTGKSTLTAALLQRGHRLLADDIIPLRIQDNQWPIFPSLPVVRLWPDSAKNFTADHTVSEAPRVHQRFEKRILKLNSGLTNAPLTTNSTPLKVIYVLKRTTSTKQNTPIIQSLSPSERLIALLENSLLGDAPRALGVEAARLQQLTHFSNQIPIRRLAYPSGFERLDEVCSLLEEDVAALHKQL